MTKKQHGEVEEWIAPPGVPSRDAYAYAGKNVGWQDC